jgi:hypothetical protein
MDEPGYFEEFNSSAIVLMKDRGLTNESKKLY